MVGGNSVGERDCELDEEIAKAERLLVEGQTFLGECLKIVRLDNFTRLVLDSDLGAIKVLDTKFYASEGLNQCDILFD